MYTEDTLGKKMKKRLLKKKFKLEPPKVLQIPGFVTHGNAFKIYEEFCKRGFLEMVPNKIPKLRTIQRMLKPLLWSI